MSHRFSGKIPGLEPIDGPRTDMEGPHTTHQGSVSVAPAGGSSASAPGALGNPDPIPFADEEVDDFNPFAHDQDISSPWSPQAQSVIDSEAIPSPQQPEGTSRYVRFQAGADAQEPAPKSLGAYKKVLLASLAAAGLGLAVGKLRPSAELTASATSVSTAISFSNLSGYDALASVARAGAAARDIGDVSAAAGYTDAFDQMVRHLYQTKDLHSDVLAVQFRAAGYIQARATGRRGLAAAFDQELRELEASRQSPLALAIMKTEGDAQRAFGYSAALRATRTNGGTTEHSGMSLGDQRFLLDAIGHAQNKLPHRDDPRYRDAYLAGVALPAGALMQSSDPGVHETALKAFLEAERIAGHRLPGVERQLPATVAAELAVARNPQHPSRRNPPRPRLSRP